MIKLKVKSQVAAALVALALILSFSTAQADTAKNVIFMISDGWGYNQIKATNYYNGTTEAYENFSVKYGMRTNSANNPAGYDPIQAWSNFDYVKSGATDSASAATAMATGIKNYDGQINIDTSGNKLKTIVEYAAEKGKATGVVTSVEFSHATPAGMYAHNISRSNYAEIANEMLGPDPKKPASPLSVIMGAGNPYYNNNGQFLFTPPNTFKYVGGETTWNQLRTNTHPGGWTLVESTAGFEALANNAKVPDKVVGVPQVFETLQEYRQPAPGANVMVNPKDDTPLNANLPDLALMTRGALNVLDNDSDGFFLMVEGGAVDWANHNNQLGRLIQEQNDFNKAVNVAIEWIMANGGFEKNLLIVTGDHECGYLTGAKDSFSEVTDNGAGNLPGAYYNSGSHTNSLIPIFAKGAGSELLSSYADEFDPKRGKYIDNTEIFYVMKSQICPTPIPGSILLLGSGVLGMVAIGLRRRRA
jgi:alkaline phosphatase